MLLTRLSVGHRAYAGITLLVVFLMSEIAFGANKDGSRNVTGIVGAQAINDVNLTTGTVGLHEELASISDFTLSIMYTSEGASRKASLRNMESSTSVLGLGWSLTRNRIVRNSHGTGTVLDDSYVIHLEGIVDELEFSDSNHTDKIKVYRIKSRLNWIVWYHWGSRQWEVVDDYGIHYIFGDGKIGGASGHLSTEHLVCWGNWMGSSVIATGQTEQISTWNLSVIQNAVGQKTSFRYSQAREQVGDTGKYFTKASYLTSVTAWDNSKIELHYAQKEAGEYVDPHTKKSGRSGNDRDAYQERFETKYLDRINQYTHLGGVNRVVTLSYNFLTGKDSLYEKRVLTKIEVHNGHGKAFGPSRNFDYYGLNPSDGVGLTAQDTFNQFNPSTGALFGALKARILPQGGSYLYQYDREEASGSAREMDIVFPPDLTYLSYVGYNQTTSWSAPELFFGTNYVVALFEPIALDCRKTHMQVYEWLGDRWVIAREELLDGYYFNCFKPMDYAPASGFDSTRNKIFGALAEIPFIGGALNGLNDGLKDAFNGVVQLGKDVGNGDLEGFGEDLFGAYGKAREDYILDIAYEFIKIADELEALNCAINPNLHDKCKYEELQKRLYKEWNKYRTDNPRKEYSITLEEDFFALYSPNIPDAVLIFQKDDQVQGKWDRMDLDAHGTTKNISLKSGGKFVCILDEATDAMLIHTRTGAKTWKTGMLWLDMNGSKQQSDIGTIEGMCHHAWYRSTMSASNNLIVATVKSPNVTDGIKVYLIHHDESMNWHTSADKVKVKRALSHKAEVIHDAFFGFDGTSEIKLGGSFAALQCYNHLNAAISDAISDAYLAMPGLMVADMLIGDLVDDLVPDYKKVNSTYGIVWDEDYKNIRVELLHSGIGQTDVGIRIDGNTINKVGRAHSTIVGSNDALFPEDGKNYAFRFDGRGFIRHEFDSKYYATAFGPDISSTVVSDGVEYKSPRFYSFNPNEIKGISLSQLSALDHALLGLLNLSSTGDLQSYIGNKIMPALQAIGDTGPWDPIDPVSGFKISTSEELDEIVDVSIDVVNIVVQVAMLFIPGAGEADIAVEEAMSAAKMVSKIADYVGNATMVAQPMAHDLIHALEQADPYSTVVLKNCISVNGTLAVRNTNESWTVLSQKAFDESDGKLVGTNNQILPGYYPYTLKNGSTVYNRVALMRNGKLNKVIHLTGAPYDKQVVHQDSLSNISGPGTFVSYGPVDPFNPGYVLPNPKRRQYLPALQPNAELRSRHAAYKDAQTVRLHKVVDNDVRGELYDYVVRTVEINDGYASCYQYYHYDEVRYDALSGISMVGKATAVPSATRDKRLAESGYKNHQKAGYTEHYFFNRNNYAIGSDVKGLPGKEFSAFTRFMCQINGTTQNSLLPVHSMEGHPYAKRIVDAKGKVIAENLRGYQAWYSDLGSGDVIDPVWTIEESIQVSSVDGVVSKQVTGYKRYPNSRTPILPEKVTTYVTGSDGLPEEYTTEFHYGFQLNTNLLDKNMLHLSASNVQLIERQGMGSKYIGANATAYGKDTINGQTMYMAESVFQAKRSKDLQPGLINYAMLAEAEASIQDDSMISYEKRLAALERSLGHYKKALSAAKTAHRKTLDSRKRIEAINDELDELIQSMNYTEHLLDSVNNEISKVEKAIDDARKLQDVRKSNVDRKSLIVAKLETLLKNTNAKIDHKRKVYDKVKHDYEVASNITEKVAIVTRNPGMFIASILGDKLIDFVEWADVKPLLKDKENIIKLLGPARDELDEARRKLGEVDGQLDKLYLKRNDQNNLYGSIIRNEQALRKDITTGRGLVKQCREALNRTLKESDTVLGLSSNLLNKDPKTKDLDDAHVEAQTTLDKSKSNIAGLHGAVKAMGKHVNSSSLVKYNLTDQWPSGLLSDVEQYLNDVDAMKDHHETLEGHANDRETMQNQRPGGYDASWLEVHEVTKRDEVTGSEIAWEDARNMASSIVLDKYHRNPVLAIKNANAHDGEAAYCGFEEYENQQISIRGNISTKDAHTGSRSMIINGRKSIDIKDFDPKEEIFLDDSVYVFSAWVRKKGWFGFSRLRVGTTRAGRQTYRWKDSKEWTYFEQVLHQADGVKNKIYINGSYVFIDDILIRPLNSETTVMVYDENDNLTSTSTENGLTHRVYYDDMGVPFISFNDAGGSGSIKMSTSSRTTGNAFKQASPNQGILIDCQGEMGILDTTVWDNHVWKDLNPAQEDFVIAFKCGDEGLQKLNAQIGKENFKLESGKIVSDGKDLFPVNKHMKNWVFLFTGGKVFVYVDGYLKAEKDRKGVRRLRRPVSITGRGFLQVVGGKEPALSAIYTDGFNRTIQTQHLDYSDNGVLSGRITTGQLYDGWGNIKVVTLPVLTDQKKLSYETGLITGYDAGTRKIRGEVAAYYDKVSAEIPNGKGHEGQYAYYENIYENNALQRLLIKVPPGEFFASKMKERTVETSYGKIETNSFLDSFWNLNSEQANLNEVKTQAPGDRKFNTITNEKGQLLARTFGESRFIATKEYDDLGRSRSAFYQPNAFAQRGTRNVLKNQYVNRVDYEDLLGIHRFFYDPDIGERIDLHSYTGESVFTSFDKLGDKGDDVNFEYYKFDQMGRMLEEGSYSTQVDYPLLETMANSGFWDDEGAVPYSTWSYNRDKQNKITNLHGRLSSSKHQQGNTSVTTTYKYDQEGSILKIIQLVNRPIGADVTQSVGYTYYANGNLKTITYPNKQVVQYSYDNHGRIKTVGTPQNPGAYAVYHYNPQGEIIEVRYNQVKCIENRFFNIEGRLVKRILKKGDKVLYSVELDYGMDQSSDAYMMGNIVGVVEKGALIRGTRSWQYTYDDQYRLSGVVERSGRRNATYRYGYDLNGNIIQFQSPESGVRNFAYQQGKNIRKGVKAENGLITNFSTNGSELSIDYNFRTEMPLKVNSAGKRFPYAQFVYDANHDRIVKSGGGVLNREEKVYLHGINDRTISEQVFKGKNNTPTIRNLVYGAGAAPMYSIDQNGSITFHVRNYQGSLMFALDQSGDDIASVVYDPFGKPTISVAKGHNATEFTYLYTAQEYDHEFGMYNFRGRLYAPEMMSFLGPDPQFNDHSPYLFVSNDPINQIDLNGEWSINFGEVDEGKLKKTWAGIEEDMKNKKLNRAGRVKYFKDIFNERIGQGATKDFRTEMHARFVATFDHDGQYWSEIHEALQDNDVRKAVSEKLRPGDMHEMLTVSRAEKLHELGFTVKNVQEWTIPTKNTVFIERATKNPGQHISSGGLGTASSDLQISKAAHKEIFDIIDAAKTREEVIQNLEDWMKGNKVAGVQRDYFLKSGNKYPFTGKRGATSVSRVGRKRRRPVLYQPY